MPAVIQSGQLRATDSLRVAHVSVRLSEGGAAGVARTLVDEMSAFGVQSQFVYGYGAGGNDSPLAEQYGAVRLTSRAGAAINLATHSVLGAELVKPNKDRRTEFARRIESVDIVHLHIVHSYFLPPTWLLETLAQSGKAVVWTLHDQWIMTGRCAQPGTCRRWETGCKSCPTLSAYPPAKVDHAAAWWVRRRDAIERLQMAVPTRIVACANWLADEARVAGFKNVSSIQNSVDREFWESVGADQGIAPAQPRSGHLFVCRDLRDEAKVRWDILRRIPGTSGQVLTIVGDNAEEQIDGTETLPSVRSREELASIMLRHRSLIFTSKVDYYPLTVAEALTAGMRIFALDSPAIREFQNNPLVTICADADALIEALAALDKIENSTRSAAATTSFDPARMASEYVDLYKEILRDAT